MSETSTTPADSATDPADFAADWAAWHEARLDATLSPYGIASLVGTHWLTEQAQEVPGLPGTWQREGEAIVGLLPTNIEVPATTLRVEPGADVEYGDILLRAFGRGEDLALRVLTPRSETRRAITEIAAFTPDPAWVFPARFEAAADETLAIELVDGFVQDKPLSGRLHVNINGHWAALVATAAGNAYSVVFADQTGNDHDAEDETYRFRFLTVPAADAEGNTVIDFNRAFVPPCGFSDHYVCPLPAPDNRLPLRVLAGERLPVDADGAPYRHH
ncbi:DUF1684 domain-containing protein [Mycetocola sp. JXN-3]|uniref:DUF1684 domain-containing protein n=1 Tax=Mycetocola sp. JXN-3 TaxID=2116510 RepID=UPI00165CFE4F|nr:DUF1684 domain-containing protein [Mycetocola sp. JXN-3]